MATETRVKFGELEIVIPYSNKPYLACNGEMVHPLGIKSPTVALALELNNARAELSTNEDQFRESNATIRSLLTALDTLKKELPFPKLVTPELAYVLCLEQEHITPIAARYRERGHTIDADPKAERAYVLHRLIRIVLEHKEGWKAEAEKDFISLYWGPDPTPTPPPPEPSRIILR